MKLTNPIQSRIKEAYLCDDEMNIIHHITGTEGLSMQDAFKFATAKVIILVDSDNKYIKIK